MLTQQDRAIAELSRLHKRLCPRQVLGVRMGRHAGEHLGLDVPRTDKRLIAIAEVDGCFADGLSVATGCWLGRRTLRVAYDGKVAATFIDLQTLAAVRIWPAVESRAAAQLFAPFAPDAWHAQLEAYQIMPVAELLRTSRVTVDAQLAESFSADSTRVTCADCGEEFLYNRHVVHQALTLCRACAGDAYFTPLQGNVWSS
jgi:formylmethanofuran dehydrogenase subunit E